MIKIWYNADMDAETPEYYIYKDKERIGWIKNVDEDGYIDEILIYEKYRNKGYGKNALISLINIEKRELRLDVKKDNIQAIKCYEKVGFIVCEAWHQNKNNYQGMKCLYKGIEQITDVQKYNNDMKKSLDDKLFFLDKIKNVDRIVDFGCADGSFLKSVPDTFVKLGVDNNIKMLKLCTEKGLDVVQSLEDVSVNDNDLLNMSSVIHEVYSYLKQSEISNFWDNVFGSGYKYIAIRDMMVNFDTKRKPDPLYDELFNESGKYYNEYTESFWYQWMAYRQYIPVQHDLIHYLLKYKYTENWKRENAEDYLPITIEYLKGLIPDNYEIIYEEEYILPYLKEQVKKDFDYEIKDNTHIKLLLKRKD